MPWLLNEDEALKKHLQGLTVLDSNADTAGRPVTVRFRMPETELGAVSYPLIVITHAGISRDPEREHRGKGALPYAPEGMPQWDGYPAPASSPYHFEEWPIPYNIDYQIVVMSRKAVHDIMLTAALATPDRLPTRFGYLEIPQDGTVRRLDLIGGPEPDHVKDQDGKTVFRQVYMVRVSSELLQTQIQTYERVLQVNVDVNNYSDTYD